MRGLVIPLRCERKEHSAESESESEYEVKVHLTIEAQTARYECTVSVNGAADLQNTAEHTKSNNTIRDRICAQSAISEQRIANMANVSSAGVV